jgi:hypothetical protein
MRDLAARPPRAVVLFAWGWPAGGAERVRAFPALSRWLAGWPVVARGDGYVVHAQLRGRGPVAAVYMLDIVHHVAPETVPPLLGRLRRCLAPGGILLVKDVDRRPVAKRWFTWALDKAMGPATPVHYWSAEALTEALAAAGFRVRRHLMVDILPYPHVLYVCQPRT